MRLFLCIYCVAMVAGLAPGFAPDVTQADSAPTPEATAPLPSEWLPTNRVGRISYVSGNVDLRTSAGAGWTDAELNQPVFAGEVVRTDPRARAEIRIGGNTIDLSNDAQIEIAGLQEGAAQVVLWRGRIGLRLRSSGKDQTGENEAVEIDVPQGGVWLLGAGRYDIDIGNGDGPLRVAVFDGTAHFAGAGGERRIKDGELAVLTEPGPADASPNEPVVQDEFAAWCRGRDYDETRLAAPYFISRSMTGYDELDSVGVWKIDPQYGPVWFPTESADWAPYRFGHWSWIGRWGWTWIDDRPWGFAPSHYGRWALIHEHWAWVPGRSPERPVYSPAVVAFLGTPGVGLSSEEGATVAWFPLAPGEVYWPSYTRDLDYVRALNAATLRDAVAIEVRADGARALEMFNEDFANREFATVVPRSIFTRGRPVASARITLPEKRLQDAPVLMASPQILPPSNERVARAVSAIPPSNRVIVRLSRKVGAKAVQTASITSRGRAQPVILRGAHLRAPSYAGPPRGRQTVVLRLAHSRGGPGKKG
jgi:Family of unknown function (DUF6600)